MSKKGMNVLYSTSENKSIEYNMINAKTIMFLVLFLGIAYYLFYSSKKTEIVEYINLTANETYIMEQGKCENKNLYYENGNVDIVSVDETGKIFALKEGNVRILSRNVENKICIIYEITIKAILSNISPEGEKLINQLEVTDSITIKKNEIIDIIYNKIPVESTEKVIFISNDENIVIVASNGKVKGIKEGNATITVSTDSGFISKLINVTVTDDDNDNNPGVELKPIIKIIDSTVNLNISENYKINYIVENINEKDIIWETNNSKVATINNGEIKGLSSGTAVITARYLDKTSASIAIYVRDKTEITKISIIEKNINIKTGDTFKLSTILTPTTVENKVITWKSSNLGIATIDNNGLIKGIKEGSAIITVTTDNGKSDTMTVTVVNNEIDATGITLNKNNLNLYVGSKELLKYSLLPNNATSNGVTWTSSNPSVAVVYSDGTVTAKSAGATVITVTTNNGKTATCMVTVNPIVATSVTLSQTAATLKTGDKLKLTYTVLPVNTADKTAIWTSSNPNVAVVYSDGTITAKSVGTTTITVTTNNGKTATCMVTVNPIVATSVTLSTSKSSLIEGTTLKLTYTIFPSNTTDKTVTWTSSKPNVAAIYSDGTLTAKSAGTTIITAKTTNGKTANYTITVNKQDMLYFIKNDDNSGANGDTIIIESKGKYAVVDMFYPDACGNIKNFISSKNIKEFEFLIITHFHEDHMGCVPEIAKTVNIKKIYYKKPSNSASDAADALKLYNKIMTLNTEKVELMSKDTWFSFQNFVISIYNVSQKLDAITGPKSNQNSESLVVVAKANNYTALLAGDIEPILGSSSTFTYIANTVGKVDIYKTAHHGVARDNPPAILSKLNPKYSIITIRSRDSVGAGAPTTENYLKSLGSKVYWTINGTVTANLSGNSLNVYQQ